MSHLNKDKLLMIVSMLIFGTIGLFVNNINLPSSFIALARSVIGSAFIAVFMLVTRHRLNGEAIKKNLKFLIPSGIAMGFNWICLFESYRFTGVAVGTLCYYMAPVIMILVSPLILKEKMTVIKAVSSAAAILGAVLISGVFSGTVRSAKGIAFGLAAAVLYASVVLMNRFVRGLSAVESTLIQMISAAAVMLPYVLITENVSELSFDRKSVIFTVIVGIIHTGIVYVFYFGSVQKIPTQTTAVFSYIDPVTAIILSAAVLHEDITGIQIIGTLLILGATLFNELTSSFKKTSGKEC